MTFPVVAFGLVILALVLAVTGAILYRMVMAARIVRHRFGIVPMLLFVALCLAAPVVAWKYYFWLIILALVLAVAGAILYSLVMTARIVRHRFGIVPMLLFVALCLAAPVVAWKYHMYRHALGHLPEALEVTTVSFRAEERWGFPGLPSGMEFGLLVYTLPEEQAMLVARGGGGYLERLPYRPRSNNSLRGLFSDWRETPMPHLPLVSSRLCDFEECPDVPARLVEQLNRIAARPGSYYARGRHGTILVSPAERLVVFMY